MQTSMQYTVGTAISRAQDEGRPVDLLVDGHWLSGRIAGYDAIGVVLDDGAVHSVVRVDRIAAVRVREQVDVAPSADEAGDARPMPGPRQTTLVPNVA